MAAVIHVVSDNCDVSIIGDVTRIEPGDAREAINYTEDIIESGIYPLWEISMLLDY